MTDSIKKTTHTILITDAEKLEINEVEGVMSFDEEGVLIISSRGKICVEGENLKIINLNKESKTIEVSGVIKGVLYVDEGKRKKRGIWS